MPAPQNQQMSRNKSVRHLRLYGYVWEWDGEDAQGNKWRRFDPKLRECSTRATTLDLKLDLKLDLVVLPQNQTGKEVLNMGNYDVNLGARTLFAAAAAFPRRRLRPASFAVLHRLRAAPPPPYRHPTSPRPVFFPRSLHSLLCITSDPLLYRPHVRMCLFNLDDGVEFTLCTGRKGETDLTGRRNSVAEGAS